MRRKEAKIETVGERKIDGLKDGRKENDKKKDNNRWIEGQKKIRRKAFRKTKGK